MIESDTKTIEQLVSHLTHQVECISNLDSFQASFLDSSSSDSSSSSSSSMDSNDVNKVNKKKKFSHLKKTKPNELALENDDDSDEEENRFNSNQKYLKTKGELTLNELEPVAQLKIDLDEKIKLIKMGVVLSIVDDKLVVIQSMLDENQKTKPLDEETILFDSNRKCLGKIFEVFGPVTSPFYSIRFNNTKEIKDYGLDVQKGAYIYYAPDSNEYTKFIFNIDELRRIKGSDASWNNDNEPPVDCLEYSDDEKEQLAKKLLKQSKKTHENVDSDSEMTDTVESLNNKKIKKNNNNKFTKSNSNFGFNQNNDFQNNNNNRQTMPQSRSHHNFANMPQQQNQQQFYPMPHQQFGPNQCAPNQFGPNQFGPNQFGPNQFMPNQGFFPHPPQMQQFNWPNPQQHNPFMNFPQMQYFQNQPFNFMQHQHQNPPAHMQQPNNQRNFEPVSNNNNNSSNNNRSPNKIVDKRFIQNNSNIIKKSF